jgi:16S rRNA (guanine527-N7)-methyltransferase
MGGSLQPDELRRELKPYAPGLSDEALQKLSVYLDLLLRWNRRINLTAIREPQRAVRELFGESIYLAQILPLQGRLIDVGTGGGFPGLALKLIVPDLAVTLIDSNRRKCAFLKEVVRECGFTDVEVVPERFELWAGKKPERGDLITTRAVDSTPQFVDSLAAAASQGAVFTTTDIVYKLREACKAWAWGKSFPLPGGDTRIVLLGHPYE